MRSHASSLQPCWTAGRTLMMTQQPFPLTPPALNNVNRLQPLTGSGYAGYRHFHVVGGRASLTGAFEVLTFFCHQPGPFLGAAALELLHLSLIHKRSSVAFFIHLALLVLTWSFFVLLGPQKLQNGD